MALSPADLLTPPGRRPWVRAAARLKTEQLGILAAGKAPEFVAVAERYARFYEGIARGEWRWHLRWRLRQADRAWAALTQLSREREAYLDDAERRLGAPPAAGAALGAGDELRLEKTPLETYVDDVPPK